MATPDPRERATERSKEFIAAEKKRLADKPLTVVEKGGRPVSYSGPYPFPDDTPPGYRSNDIDDLPNMEKLSSFERTVIDWLPGFSETGVGKALAKFGESPFGKLLQIFDVGAEGIERFSGFAAQALVAVGTPESWQEFRSQLGSAWYAGGLAADMANLPQVRGVFDFLNKDAPKQALGIAFPSDLPGIEGLVQARQQIDALTREGMDLGDALIQVRAEYYNGLGSLAIRAQLNDLFAHVAGDPLNLLFPYLKPVERIQKLLRLNLAKQIPQTIADDVARLTGLLDEATDAGNAVRVAEIREGLQVLETVKPLGPWEYRILKVMNAIPGEEPKLPGIVRFIGKPFQLTPETRAHALVVNVGDNVLDRIIGRGDDPFEIVRALERAADGTLGPEFGHMVVSIEGRAVRATTQAMAGDARQLLNTYKATEFERVLVNTIADSIGDTPTNVILRINEGEAAVIFQQFSEKFQDIPGLQRLLATRGLALDTLTQDELAKAAAIFDKWPVYDLNTFKASLMVKVGESTAKLAVAQFGVKSRGTLQAMSQAIKSAETLAFLRMNPSYPIKNWINNNFTMLARGTFGRVGKNFGRDFWKRWGSEPLRLRVGFGFAGLEEAGRVGAPAIEAAGKIFQAARVPKPGWTDRISGIFKGVNLGPADTGVWAQGMEAASSVRGTTAGVMRGMRKYFWRPDNLEDFNPVLAQIIGDDGARQIQKALRGALSPDELDDVFFSKNLNISEGAIMDEASRRFGGDIDNILSTEYMVEIGPDLVRAAEKGPSHVRAFVSGLREDVQTHIDDLVDESLSVIRDEAAALVETEGPAAFIKLWVDQTDEFYGSHGRWSNDISRLAGAARDLDPKTANAVWKQSQLAGERFWKRSFDRFEARIEGMAAVGKKIKMPMVGEIKGAFKSWRREWQGFIRTRNRLWDEFFEAKLAGNKPKLTAEVIQSQLDELYKTKTGIEDGFMNQIDELTARFLPDNQRPLFMAWRETVAEFRRADRELVSKFRREARDIPADQLDAAWRQHWQQRQSLWAQIAGEERAGLAAMQGEPQAVARYTGRIKPLEEAAGEAVEDFSMSTLPDFHSVVGREMNMGTGVDQLWFTRGDDALSAIQDAALDLRKRPAIKFKNFPADQQDALRQYVTHVKGQMSDARYQSLKFGEWMRDSALLNYNRRYNYNSWLGVMAPYEFWFTQSIYKWAIHSLDRPAMASNFLRMKQFLETAYRPEEGFPQRLKGTIRIPTPFLPEWLGKNLFIDPMRTALPLGQFVWPWEEAINQQFRDEGATTRTLEELLNDTKITQAEYEEAINTKSGPVWDRAETLARQYDTEGRLNGFDFMTMLAQPHAPIMWAYNLAKGQKEDIGPFLPITRSIRGATALLGIGPVGGVNIEGAIRERLGLPAFDKWDDYRVDRMLSSMAARGEISVEDAKRAMIDRVGDIYNEAVRKAAIEWGVGAMGSTIGIPTKAYPEGEENLRQLKDEYEAAWTLYEGGDLKALNRFYERFPEYETRLALFKSPEERLRNFLVGEMWDWWNDAPKVHKDQVKEHLGPLFRDAFLDKDTRSIDSIPLNTMQVWLKIIGGDPVGGMVHFSETLTPLEFAPAEEAQRVQVFYDTRESVFRYNEIFPDLWDSYRKLDQGGKRAFRQSHPIFGQYLWFRDDFMQRNPSVAQYIEDDPKFRPKFRSEAALQQAVQAEPNFTALEWQQQLGFSLYNLTLDILEGETVPPVVRDNLDKTALELGLSGWTNILSLVGSATGLELAAP